LARAGWAIDIVAFEPPSAALSTIVELQTELAHEGIEYQWTRRDPSHSFAVKVREASYAFSQLLIRALRKRPQIVHARSYLPGATAQLVAWVAPDTRFLFDCRGLLGDEYADFGHWGRDSFRYRLLKRVERVLFSRADGVVVLTERLKEWLLTEGRLISEPDRIEVIPCCVDLDRFVLSEEQRVRGRQLLGAGDRFVLAYAGSLGAWYSEDEMVQLFAAIRRRRPALFSVFSRSPADRVRAAMARHGVREEDVLIRPAAPEEMPTYLAGADAAISFAQPRFSKIAASPVKIAEYLALGIPVVMNRGVGDGDELIDQVDAVIDAGRLSPDDLDAAAARLSSLCSTPESRHRARAAARARFDLAEVGVARYQKVYRRLAG
jgi:glycosyltransferase involved in cell wall biosynthesis